MKFPTKSSFREWLKTKSPNSFVGVKYDMEYCPLALYLNELTSCKSYVDPAIMIENSGYSIGDGEEKNLPKWANDFALFR